MTDPLDPPLPPAQARGALARVWLVSGVMFLLMLGVGLSVVWVDWRGQVQQRQREVTEVVNSQANLVQQRLTTAVSATYALAAVLRQREYQVDVGAFQTLATELLRYHPGVSSLQYAPGGITTYIVPMQGNEKAVGNNLMLNTDRNKEARLAIETKALTMAGPFELRQGGVGLAGRLPIFRPTADGGEAFWGFAVALIRVPELLDAAHLSRLGQLGYRYRLWRIHPDTGAEHVFAAETDRLDAVPRLTAPVVVPFDVPNGTWYLSAEPINGWGSPWQGDYLLKVLLVILVAAAFAVTLFTLMRQPLVLGGLVARRTRQLETANAQLAAEAEVRRDAEAQLRLSAKVFEASAEAIMITDDAEKIVSVNDAFTLMTGFTRDEALGASPSMLASGRHDAGFFREMYAILRRDGHWQGEVWNRRKNGEVFPQWTGINVLTDEAHRITHYVSIASDITERKASEERIHYLAHYDALTGLPNRVLLRDRILQATAQADRQQAQVAILSLDLDRFKVVNESLGHHVGDLLLQRVVARLRDAVRATDTISRQGGDEFLIVVPDHVGVDSATKVAQKIQDLLAQPFDIDGHELRVTSSIGISIYPADGRDVDTLLKYCDIAMYYAKESGRATYRFYTQAMNENADERLAIEAELARAVARQEFVLYYQPQVDLSDGRIAGAEALIRWRHPDKGLVPPGRFIPVAEETGLIVPIGEWVLREACRQASAWQAAGLPPVVVSVNLSGLQFRRPAVVALVADALAESGLAAEYLELELTESILVQNVEQALQTIDALKALGVKLAIDDFGTGYSSLSYLKRFSVDKLKIDQSFIRDLCTDPDDAAIVQAVIQLGQSLNLKTIAEGTETLEQIDALRSKGCLHVQGYYFSKPLPADEFAAFLRDFNVAAAGSPT